MKWILPSLYFACSGAQTTSSTTAEQTDSTQDTQSDTPQVYINEVLAKTDLGNQQDWIELYNAEAEAIDLTGFGVYDSAQETWDFPAGTMIPAKGFLIVWADDAAEEGLHASFKLSKDGEEVVLVDSNGKTIDSVLFPALEAEESYARIIDGDAEWEIRMENTPGESNLLE